MSKTPLIHYTWIYQCRRCKKSFTKYYSSTNSLLEIDPNAPKGPCSCVSLDGKWRPSRGDRLLDEPDNDPKWYCLCDCGGEWTEPRIPGRAQMPEKVCSICFPQGMWQLKRFSYDTKPRMAMASKFQEDLPTTEAVVASDVSSETKLDSQSIQKQDHNSFKKSHIFQILSNLKRKISKSDQQQDDDRTGISSFQTAHRPSFAYSLMDIDIPSHEIELLIPRFDSQDEDEDMEEARGFSSDHQEDSSSDDGEVPASLLTEVDEEYDEYSLVQSSQLSIGEQVENEDADPENIQENDTSLGIFSHARVNRRQVNIWSPEEGHVRIDVDLRTVNAADLRLRDTPSVESDLPGSPTTLEMRRPENAARIQEVRDFFSIPESVPTSSIPSFIRDHQRVGWSLQSGIVLTGGGLTFRNRHPHIWLLSTQAERLAEINQVVNSDTIVWEDGIGREVSQTDIVGYDARAADAEGLVTLDSRIDFIRLDGEDERQFWSAVGVSEGESSRLVAEEQEPRLPTDPDSPHGVWEASDLILEVNVQVDECEPDSEDERDDLEE
ncbi:hypothetical protein DL98DRAFT_529802 [Cadophora sp. DSE1049]|nr:hypothetical protein DL98DRAFT_529802 [Cadophora sp. DSE1049]